MKEALFFKPLLNDKVQCLLCPHQCILSPDKTGICRQRKNINGKLFSLNYAQASAIALDPIEKKPLYHFHPGIITLSLGTNGCNLSCDFCQNWHISQTNAPTQYLSPQEAIQLNKEKNSSAISYTYNEPFIWFEFVLETAQLAKKNNMKNIMVSNGFYSPEPIEKLLPYIDAFNIDIKSIEPDFYKRLCKAKLDPVLQSCIIIKKHSFLEITNLIIPHENDSLNRNIKILVKWIKDNLGADTPLHFSAYYPTYKRSNPSTPLSTLLNAYQLAKEELHHVYIGNVANPQTSHSYCKKCNAILIERFSYHINISQLDSKGNCKKCGTFNDFLL